MGISLAAVGTAFRFIVPSAVGPAAATGPSNAGIVTLLALVGFIICFAFSTGPVVWTVINEAFPGHIRGRAVYPNAWRVKNLTFAAIPLASFRLLYLVAILGLGWYWLRLSPDQMQTVTFTMLVFAGQGNVYVLRERGHLWHSCPAPVMLLASGCDLALVAGFTAGGILMSPLPIWIIPSLVATTVLFSLAMDTIKLTVFTRLRID